MKKKLSHAPAHQSNLRSESKTILAEIERNNDKDHTSSQVNMWMIILCQKSYKKKQTETEKVKKLEYLFWELLGTAVLAGAGGENAFFSAPCCNSTTALVQQGCEDSLAITGRLCWDAVAVGGVDDDDGNLRNGGGATCPCCCWLNQTCEFSAEDGNLWVCWFPLVK